MPSWTSSSCTVGTYWRQIGSSGAWIRSTIAGEIRNSKFAAAWCSLGISGKWSGPNRAASCSSDVRLRLRSSSCQVSIRQILEIDHQVVTGRVVAREGGGPGVAAAFVKAARRLVGRARGRFDDDEAAAIGDQLRLHRPQKLPADAVAPPLRIHGHPIQILRPARSRRPPPTSPTPQRRVVVRTEEAVVLVPCQRLVEQLERGRDLLPAQ